MLHAFPEIITLVPFDGTNQGSEFDSPDDIGIGQIETITGSVMTQYARVMSSPKELRTQHYAALEQYPRTAYLYGETSSPRKKKTAVYQDASIGSADSPYSIMLGLGAPPVYTGNGGGC